MPSSLSDILAIAQAYERELPAFEHTIDLENRRVASYVDHSFLKPDITPAHIEQVCREAREHAFAAVSINPVHLRQMVKLLQGSAVGRGTVVGFPLGAVPTHIKAAETRAYVEEGATELDTMIQVGLLKAGEYQAVWEDVAGVVEIAHASGVIVKVILENCLLTRSEKILACLLCQAAGADFVKTSSGFSTGGATVEDVELMRRVVGPTSQMGVKAATGIRSLEIAEAMLRAGANRLGTSAGVKIDEEQRQRKAAG